jgi:hypothetical protein
MHFFDKQNMLYNFIVYTPYKFRLKQAIARLIET